MPLAAGELVLLSLTAVTSVWAGASGLTVGLSKHSPLGYVRPDGTPGGFAVEVLNEAARREGIRLKWREISGSPDEALASAAIDIWPAAVDLPRRRGVFHLTAAWWHAEMQILARADVTDLASRRIGYLRGLGPELLRNVPAAIPVPVSNYRAAVSEVCGATLDGVILDRNAIQRELLHRSAGCASTAFRLLPLPDAHLDLSILTRHEHRETAERLRRGIDKMGLDGALAAIAARHPAVSTASTTQAVAALRGRYQQTLLGFWLLFACVLLAGSISIIHRLRRDLSARKRTLAELERSEARLARAHRIALLGWWEADLQTGTAEWSPTAREILGIESAGAGRGPKQLLARVEPQDRDRIAAALEHTIVTGQPLSAECWMNGPESRRFVGHQAEAVKGGHGEVVRLVGTVQDLTAHKRLEEQLLQSQKLESVGRLAGGIAHDFNNLLTVINGYTEVLQADLEETHPMRPALLEVGKAGARAAALATQLLAFSRKQPAQTEALCLNSVVTEAERMLRRLLGEKVEIVTELDPNLGIVKADPGQMQQVLMNLVVNARDAMPDGGRVVIATANVSNGRCPDGKPGPLVALSVADSGCGMDAETKARIFEPFFTTKPKGRGTGLGLSTVYGIVQQSGGWIAVDSGLNQGTAFRIFLPQVQS